MPDTSTRTGAWDEQLGPGARALELMLEVTCHAEPAQLGQRLVLTPGRPLRLGRGGSSFASGVLDDPLLSRSHLAIEWRDALPVVRDLGSHNGTFVNGRRIGEARLEPGDVLGAGSILWLLHRGRRDRLPQTETDLVAASAAMLGVDEQIAQVAGSDVTVLIQGPTGSGKEVVAREIHRRSGREGELVAVNCAALSDGVVASELFGHRRGAFSGASEDRGGLVAAASRGTLLLDEIGDASPSLQASLLRLLENREYRPVGSDRARQADARVLAATHVPLAEAVAAGRLRDDLLARLDRWVIELPPLSQRPADIVPLARRFLRARAGAEARLSAPLTLALLRHRWPNNVRELGAVIERAVIEAGTAAELPLTDALRRRLNPPAAPATADPTAGSSPVRRARPSAGELRKLFRAEGGNMRALAARLGVGRATLYRWLEQLGLTAKQLRDELR